MPYQQTHTSSCGKEPMQAPHKAGKQASNRGWRSSYRQPWSSTVKSQISPYTRNQLIWVSMWPHRDLVRLSPQAWSKARHYHRRMNVLERLHLSFGLNTSIWQRKLSGWAVQHSKNTSSFTRNKMIVVIEHLTSGHFAMTVSIWDLSSRRRAWNSARAEWTCMHETISNTVLKLLRKGSTSLGQRGVRRMRD